MDRFDSVLPKQIHSEQQYTTPTRHESLPYKNVGKLVGTTPSVQNIEVAVCDGSAITQLRNGMEGQTIRVLGDGVSSISCESGVIALTADLIFSFTCINQLWYVGA